MLGGGGFAQTGGGGYGTSVEPAVLLWAVIFALALMVLIAIGQCQVVAALWRICAALKTRPPRGTVRLRGGDSSEEDPLLGGEQLPTAGAAGGAGFGATDDASSSAQGVGTTAKSAQAAPRQQAWGSFVSSLLPPASMMRMRRPAAAVWGGWD